MRKCAWASRKSPAKMVIYVYSAVCMNLSIPFWEPIFILGGILLLFSHPVVSGSLKPQVTLCLTISQSLPKFMFIASVMPSSHLILWCFLLLLSSIFPTSGTFPMSRLFASDDQNTRASASTSVLPVNIQSWSPLRLTDLISLLPKGLSGVFSSTTVWGH